MLAKMDQLQLETRALKVRELNFSRKLFITALVLCIIIESLAFQLLPPLDRLKPLYYSFIFEFIGLLSLLFIFLIVQFAPLLNFRAHALLSVGLFLWILASVVDVGDEFFYQPLWLSLWGEDVLRTIGMVVYTMGIMIAIKTVSVSYNQIKKLSMIDELTQLPNRRYFKQMLSNHENQSFLILLIDVDHFKKINDLFGHDEGDLILQSLGNSLSGIMTNNVTASRIGGEEFAIFIDSSGRQNAIDVANIIMREADKISSEHKKTFTVSIGITLKSPSEPSREAIKRADAALYNAKAKGRNRFEWSS